MQGTEHQALTNDELLQHIYSCNYNVSVGVVKELYERFVDLLENAEPTADDRQLSLPL